MIWAFLAAGLFLAATMGAAIASLLTTIRPEWSLKKRRLVAASILPAITLACTIAFALMAYAGTDPSMNDLVAITIVTWGAGFALLALVGGVVGAFASMRARRG